jgi:hypothetical protein
MRRPLGQTPAKWRKYELLEAYGLAKIDFLKHSIRRFPWNRQTEALAQLQQELHEVINGDEAQEHFLFIVKFVPRELAILLPNFRIKSLSDMETLACALQKESRGKFEEIWFCKTLVRTGAFSVAGRISVDSLGGSFRQTIEQVWRCSPRLIETLSTKFPYPFIRASRQSWGWFPRIEHMHRPDTAPEDGETMMSDFSAAMRMLNERREQLEEFSDRVISVGASVCSLEYKIEGNHLQIIDWDSSDDYMVVQRLLPNEYR